MAGPDAVVLGTVANLGIGVLLVFLAAIVATASPNARARGPLALFLTLVGLNYFLDAAGRVSGFLGGPEREFLYAALLPALLDPPVLLYFALRLTQPSVSRRTAALMTSPGLLVPLLFVLAPPPSPYLDAWAYGGLFPAQLAFFYTMAFALVVRSYLEERRPIARDRLASIVLALGVIVLPRLPLLAVDVGVLRATDVEPLILALVAVTGVTTFVTVPFLNPLNREHALSTGRRLYALLAVVIGTWMLILLPGLRETVWPLVYSIRWFLVALVLTDGMERYELLSLAPHQARRVKRGLSMTFVLLAGAQVSALLAAIPDTSTLSSVLGGIATVGIGTSVYVVISRSSDKRRPELAWRRLNVYRAHLELGTDPDELERLRERLSIPEREDADLRTLIRVERALPRSGVTPELAEGSTVLGRYEIQGFLGVGSFGRTFVAWDALRQERVVLKEMLGQYHGDEGAVRHLRREAEAMMAVEHPNVVGFRALERLGAGYVLVEEYIEGRDLRARTARGRLSPEQVIRVARETLAGLAALHERGIVHRDIKPENIMMRPDGSAVLLDLGTATARDGRTATRSAGGSPGTPLYMSPEQEAGDDVGPTSDLYSLALVLWELLAGRRYPHGDVPAAWRPVLEVALRDAPEERFPDAGAMLEALPDT